MTGIELSLFPFPTRMRFARNDRRWVNGFVFLGDPLGGVPLAKPEDYQCYRQTLVLLTQRDCSMKEGGMVLRDGVFLQENVEKH